MLVLADLTSAFLFARFLVDILLGLVDDLKGNWQPGFLSMIQRCQEIDPFDSSILGMIPMPTDDLILVRVRLFLNRIVYEPLVLV